jgi:hypothetical protein
MIVVAQKKSMDPVQQALRERKAKWNKEVSAFIDNLIHLKKMMNGWPSKFLMERSRITEALPKDPATILGALAQDFTKLVQTGNDIIAAQVAYSQTRKKKQVRPVEAPAAGTPAPVDLSQQLSLPNVASEEYYLISEASNYLTRFLATKKGPRFGDSIKAIKRRNRISLLGLVHDLYKLCSKFQREIVKKTKDKDDLDNIEKANEILLHIENHFFSIMKQIDIAAVEIKKAEPIVSVPGTPDNATQVTTNSVVPSSNVPDQQWKLVEQAADAISKEWQNVTTVIIDIDPTLRTRMNELLIKYNQNNETKSTYAKEIINLYNEILLQLNATRGTSAKSLTEIVEINKKAQLQSEIQKLSQDFMGKWLDKTRRSINPGKTGASRLAAYKAIKLMRIGLDHVMDLLEKDFNTADLSNLMYKEVFEPFSFARQAIGSLLGTINYDPSQFTGKQRQQLDSVIEKRKMRQMTERLAPKIPPMYIQLPTESQPKK